MEELLSTQVSCSSLRLDPQFKSGPSYLTWSVDPCQVCEVRVHRHTHYLTIDIMEFIRLVTKCDYLCWTNKSAANKNKKQRHESHFHHICRGNCDRDFHAQKGKSVIQQLWLCPVFACLTRFFFWFFFVIPAQTLRRSPKQMYWLILIEEHFMFRLN